MLRRLTLITSVLLAAALGCSSDRKHAHHEHEGEHVAAHGGCLNAMGTCENGHAEAKVEGEMLKVWFVGGGTDTEKAVRIPDKEITLAVTVQGEKEAKPLVLTAKPNELAEEKVGDCSVFEGQADWLNGVKEFVATGEVTFKGKKQAVRIEYPAGYDPD